MPNYMLLQHSSTILTAQRLTSNVRAKYDKLVAIDKPIEQIAGAKKITHGEGLHKKNYDIGQDLHDFFLDVAPDAIQYFQDMRNNRLDMKNRVDQAMRARRNQESAAWTNLISGAIVGPLTARNRAIIKRNNKIVKAKRKSYLQRNRTPRYHEIFNALHTQYP